MKLGVKEIVFVGIVAVGFGVFMWYYNSLGGFNEIKVQANTNTTYLIQGKYFEGSVRSREFGEVFSEIESAINESGIQSFAVAYYEKAPSDLNGYNTKVFIGALITEDSLNRSFSFKEVSFERSYYAEQEAKLLGVATKTKLEEMAEDSVVVLDPHRALEFYYSPERFGMEIPYHEITK